MYKKCFSFSASVETEYETKSWHPGLEFEAAKKEIDNKWEEKDDFWNTDKGAYSFTIIELVFLLETNLWEAADAVVFGTCLY